MFPIKGAERNRSKYLHNAQEEQSLAALGPKSDEFDRIHALEHRQGTISSQKCGIAALIRKSRNHTYTERAVVDSNQVCAVIPLAKSIPRPWHRQDR